jgi:hypothetical protein
VVKTKAQHFAILEFNVLKSSFEQFYQTQVATCKPASDKFYGRKVSMIEVTVIEMAVFVLPLRQRVFLKVNVVIAFVVYQDLFHVYFSLCVKCCLINLPSTEIINRVQAQQANICAVIQTGKSLMFIFYSLIGT